MTTNRSSFDSVIFFLLISCSSFTFAAEECAYETTGTTVPNTSGTPLVISPSTGTVISANFFDSGAIDPPYFDGMEFVSVCVKPPNANGEVTATITTDVGLDDDTRIKGYPQFVIGTKFGNQYETSFTYYQNHGLPLDHQWPVKATNISSSGAPFEFANIEYVSLVQGIGLPAFTNALPEVIVTLDIDEQNVIGAERDVMLESWFYDTSANSQLIGNNQATGLPIANTLNNIVGIGHPHYAQLNNTLLEMMVHIGPLSPNDVSESNRNPGQNQLTENYSGKDFDGDGIDDHFDVDSHINLGTNIEPQPGIYSSGIDDNSDGIDDADILPITIGSYQYSIWYGESYLAPIVIFSRETNATLQNDFNPLIPDMDLSSEGEISLNWNEFLEYTTTQLEGQLKSIGVAWVTKQVPPLQDHPFYNPFPKMTAAGGAIGGIELGVEPQINNPTDSPYVAVINKFDVRIDGYTFGLSDNEVPTVAIELETSTQLTAGPITVSGTSIDNVQIDRNKLLIRKAPNGQYWNGTAWANSWAWFEPNGSDQWSYELTLSAGDYIATAWTWDTSNNISNIDTLQFSVDGSDTTTPTLTITPLSQLTPGFTTISGTTNDNIDIDRNKLLLRNTTNGQYWNGSSWTTGWSWFTPSGTTAWSYGLTLPAANFTATAWTWDTSNNIGNIETIQFIVGNIDTLAPAVSIDQQGTLTQGPVSITGTSSDNVAIDRNRLLIRNISNGQYWNGTAWTSAWAWFEPAGTSSWSFTITLPASNFTTTAWTWDTSNNVGNIETKQFSVAIADTTPPTVNIVGPTAQSAVSTGDVFIYLSSTDNVAIDRNKLLIRNLQTGNYWNGQQWEANWSWITPSSGPLESSYTALTIVDEGLYSVVAWTWDTANNASQTDQETIDVHF